jgi:hypothetical protein
MNEVTFNKLVLFISIFLLVSFGKQMAALAARCVQEMWELRPSISIVVQELESLLYDKSNCTPPPLPPLPSAVRGRLL